MTRRLHNWTYWNVTDFIIEQGFSFHKEIGGSHQAWIKPGNDNQSDRIVTVNFTRGSYPVKTLRTMIRQSGVHQDKWLKWARS